MTDGRESSSAMTGMRPTVIHETRLAVEQGDLGIVTDKGVR